MVIAMRTASNRIRRRPGWLVIAGTSAAIFLVVLALLWVRVSGGQDPVLGAGTSAAQVSGSQSTDDTTRTDDTTTSSSDSTSQASADVPTTHAS
jgi:hypothetical protein